MKNIPVVHIDTGVPMPLERRNTLEVYPLNRLEVGESILFSREDRARVQVAASQLKKRSGKNFTIRIMDEENARVWRTS